MEKELNKKLKLDSINWVEVVLGLEGKTTFTNHDIKRAFKSTGRSFNTNGPFYSAVKDFIEALNDSVTVKRTSEGWIYTIQSTEDALKALGYYKISPKNLRPTREECPIRTMEDTKEVKTPEVSVENETMPDEDKIKDLFKKSYSALDHAICLLAIFMKYAKKELSNSVILTEFSDLGINPNTFSSVSKPTIMKIFDILGYNTLKIKKLGRSQGSLWRLDGTMDLLDEYTNLVDVYEKLTNKKPRNLDDYITAKIYSNAEIERKYETLKEIEEIQKRIPREPRKEKNQEIVWKKWLLVSASRANLGASRPVSILVSWIKTNRFYEIDENEALKLYRELMEDSEGGLNLSVQNYVTLTEDSWKRLSKFYSPKQFKETILVKLPISLENATNIFQGLTFKLDETTTSGMYLYTVEINRSISCEFALKKLLRFIQISGKLYTENSWMVERTLNIISKEDSEERLKYVTPLRLEEKNLKRMRT